MATVNLGGYDPNTGWPPDDSTGVNWDPDVDIPGQFGRGGFYGAPRLTGPATGPPPGISLSGPGGAAAPTGPDVVPPTNSTIPTGKMPVPRTGNPFTDAHINPATGQPEMLTGPGGIVEKTRGALNPFGFLGGSNPYWRGAIAAGGVLTPTPTASNDTISPEMARARPEYPHTPTPQNYPMWPTPPAPAAAPSGGIGSDARFPVGPSITGTPAPAVPPPRPRAAGAPNLGTYGAPPAPVPNSPFTTLDYRPNSGPNERNRGSPVATALDLSRLFGGGQPAAPAPPVPYPPPRPPVYNNPSIRMVPPAIPIGGGAGNVLEAPSKRKSSSTSQGGGY